MILDRLEFASRYHSLHAGFGEAFDFLQRPNLATMPNGKVLIRHEDLYATISDDPARNADQARLEAHRKYIDIQYIIAGTDRMGWKNTDLCTSAAADYDPARDLIFFRDAPDLWISVPAGAFVVFFPEDAHAPLVGTGTIRKVVVKIAV